MKAIIMPCIWITDRKNEKYSLQLLSLDSIYCGWLAYPQLMGGKSWILATPSEMALCTTTYLSFAVIIEDYLNILEVLPPKLVKI